MPDETVYLGIGSNLGDRYANLQNAVNLLSRSLRLAETSSLYETEPWGYREQPWFLNVVCRAVASVSPEGLLAVCKEVEADVGRTPTFRYGPRVLDIDILFYGPAVVRGEALEIPHPRLDERAFVLVPLAELAPDWVHPALHKTVSELLTEVKGTEEVRLWGAPLAVP